MRITMDRITMGSTSSTSSSGSQGPSQLLPQHNNQNNNQPTSTPHFPSSHTSQSAPPSHFTSSPNQSSFLDSSSSWPQPHHFPNAAYIPAGTPLLFTPSHKANPLVPSLIPPSSLPYSGVNQAHGFTYFPHQFPNQSLFFNYPSSSSCYYQHSHYSPSFLSYSSAAPHSITYFPWPTLNQHSLSPPYSYPYSNFTMNGSYLSPQQDMHFWMLSAYVMQHYLGWMSNLEKYLLESLHQTSQNTGDTGHSSYHKECNCHLSQRHNYSHSPSRSQSHS